jgi:myo-inositol-1-phosphate synthase
VGTGVWLVGANGSVAVTATVGALSIGAGLAGSAGCVTELAELYGEPDPGHTPPSETPLRSVLPAVGDLVFGGHDLVTDALMKKAANLAEAGVVPARHLAGVRDRLAAVEAAIRPAPLPFPACPGQDGSFAPGGSTLAEALEAAVEDIRSFARHHDLERVVVVNVASSEAAVSPHPAHADLATLQSELAKPLSPDRPPVLPPSSLYAYAAFSAGCPFVDFTPSTGARLAALAQYAEQQRVPYAGNDGKTGQTLLKSVLVPMFARRHLRVRTWSGINLLGGGDGATLADPAVAAAKRASKQRVLAEGLPEIPQGDTWIKYVPELGDFKTAWDLITFDGFLGVPMRMDITWHGCDSALAAPLVLDLARLVAAAHRAGRVGPLPELAFFFKDPLACSEHGLAEQWATLCAFVRELCDA